MPTMLCLLCAVIVETFSVANNGKPIYSDICKVKGIHWKTSKGLPQIQSEDLAYTQEWSRDWAVLLTQNGPNSPLDLS